MLRRVTDRLRFTRWTRAFDAAAKVVLIATGSRPQRPKGAAFELPGVFDTDTILYRERGAPKAIVIVGGGPVGIEFATICRALGAPGHDRRSRRASGDDDGRRGLRAHRRTLSGLGVQREIPLYRWKTSSQRLKTSTSAFDERARAADTVLIAAGRVANTRTSRPRAGGR